MNKCNCYLLVLKSAIILNLDLAINGNSPFPTCDWRFNEFPSPAAHALYVTCVEMMALPVPGDKVGRCLLDVVLKR